MILESACIPVPSEVIMLYAGFLVSGHHMSLPEAVAAGVAGNVVGSAIAWAVGAYGGRELILRHGRKVHVSGSRLELAERWFARWGPPIVLFSRCLPVIRTFISLPAGLARMPFGRFTAYTLVGSIPWVLALALLGKQVGDHWETWHKRFEIGDYLIVGAAVLVVVALLVVHFLRRRAVRPVEE